MHPLSAFSSPGTSGLKSIRDTVLMNAALGMTSDIVDNHGHLGGLLDGAASAPWFVGQLGPALPRGRAVFSIDHLAADSVWNRRRHVIEKRRVDGVEVANDLDYMYRRRPAWSLRPSRSPSSRARWPRSARLV